MTTQSNTGRLRVAAVAVCMIAMTQIAADKLVAFPKPSTYAPAKDLIAQVEYFIGRIKSDLEDEDEYGEDQQNRVIKDACTIAAIGLVLANHDEKHALKAGASALIESATTLSDEVEDLDAAREAFAEIKVALKKKGDSEPLEWEPVADLTVLMEQVPIINNSLRRGVTGRRFKRSADRNAGYAATLAAIAQASLIDDAYCGDEEETELWQKICADMRAASMQVNKAVREADQDAAKEALGRLVETCDACHESFRD